MAAYWNIKDLADYLGIKPSTVYALVEEKRIPHYRIGRLIRFKREEIDLWMEGNRQETLDLAGKKLIAAPQRRQRLDVDHIVKKAVAQAKRKKVY
jgi:excisionase family DNA binding protein